MLLINQLITPILYIILDLLEPLMFSFVAWDKNLDKVEMQQEQNKNVFDFIIVGGGSAGCQLANKLSVKYDVLLLEAGGLPNPYLEIPSVSFLLNNQKPVDWAHRTVPQKYAAWGLNNNIIHWPAGRQLGGSSTINGLINSRGNVQGFDTIAELTGDPRWKLNNVLKYYRELEDYHGFFDDGSHAKGGSLGIQKAPLMPFTYNLLKAGEELGYRIRDPNPNDGPYTEGFAPMESYLKFGRRSDAFKGDLKPIMNKRKNLSVKKFSFVTKIILVGNTAIGVDYERHGTQYSAYVTKGNPRMLLVKISLSFEGKVILSAGALHSPKILMLSGIGPKHHLQEVGIEPLVDLPVGTSLQDQYGAAVGPFMVDDGKSFKPERDITLSTLLEWYSEGTGVYSSTNMEAAYSIVTDSAKREGRVDAPNIQVYVYSSPNPTNERTQAASAKAYNYKPETLEFFNLVQGKESFMQIVTISKRNGTGYIKLQDANPHSPLIIDPKYFEDILDVKTIVEGIKFAVKVVEETKAFKELNAGLLPVSFPGCENHVFKSDAYYECLARHITYTAYKYCGTAPIGKDSSDKRAVVDSKLRVLNTKGLRVVDGSVLQMFYVSENDVTVRMLGRLASDIILDDWNELNVY